jgi:putative membrane protein
MQLLTPVMAIVTSVILSGCSLFQWAMPGTTLSDANVIAMFDTINLSEIDAADLAKQRASSEVRTFASQMQDEHAAMLQDTRQLAQRINIQPQAPALASTAGTAHLKTMEELRQLSGADFDRAYVKYQIKMHEQAIALIQDTADSIDDQRLQQHLRKARPDLDSHLSAARSIERNLIAKY